MKAFAVNKRILLAFIAVLVIMAVVLSIYWTTFQTFTAPMPLTETTSMTKSGSSCWEGCERCQKWLIHLSEEAYSVRKIVDAEATVSVAGIQDAGVNLVGENGHQWVVYPDSSVGAEAYCYENHQLLDSTTVEMTICCTKTPCQDEYTREYTDWLSINSMSFEFIPVHPEERIPEEISVIEEWCPVPDGYAMIYEPFSDGQTITKLDFRFPVLYFCGVNPIVIVDQETGAQTYTTDPFYQLVAGEVVEIPPKQVWLIPYGTRAISDLNMICPDGSLYNADTNRCEVYPAIVLVCREGVLDSEKGICTVQPDMVVECPEGSSYNADEDACIKKLPATLQCDIGVPNYEKGICEIKAEHVALCEKGYYDTSLEMCVWQPPVQADCKGKGTYDPDRGVCVYDADFEEPCDYGGKLNVDTGFCEYLVDMHQECTYFCYGTDKVPIDCEEKWAEYAIDAEEENLTLLEWIMEYHGDDIIEDLTDCRIIYECPNGGHREGSMCVYTPNTAIPKCTEGVWDEEMRACVVTTYVKKFVPEYIDIGLPWGETLTVSFAFVAILVLIFAIIAFFVGRWLKR